MNQEVIRDFLNVPGIVGIALLSRHSQPVFYSPDPAFVVAQTEILSDGILQVVESIPTEFERLEFRFAKNQVVLHRFASGLILLIVCDNPQMNQQQLRAFEALRSLLQSDAQSAIVAFQSLTAFPLPTLEELLAVINHVGQFATTYLGTAVIANYLKLSRPSVDWMQQFQIERSGQVRFLGESSILERSISAEEQAWICSWITTFIQRCSQIVRNFTAIVEQSALTESQKALLLP